MALRWTAAATQEVAGSEGEGRQILRLPNGSRLRKMLTLGVML
jgi:hypothetical protein